MAVLYAEIIINSANGLVSLFAPALSLQGMCLADLSTGAHDLALEVARWFGVMGLVFGGFLLYRVLHIPSALKLVLEALLVGDVLYCGSLIPFALRWGRWPLIAAPFLLTLVMFVARLTYYLTEDWAKLEAVAQKARAR